MNILTEPDTIRLVITLTPKEAQELMDIFDKTIDPSTTQKMLYSALGNISNMTSAKVLEEINREMSRTYHAET